MTWSVCPSIASMAEEIPPLACLHVALIKLFLYSRKSCFPRVHWQGTGNDQEKGGRRGAKIDRKKDRRKQSCLKSYGFVCGYVFQAIQRRFYILSECLCLYKSERACMRVYTFRCIMSLACVCKFISASLCGRVCASVGACTHFWQISRRITVISYFHFWQW